ncbi:alginate lyase family protein [Microbacterium nymphoidis]|uniref:alginate lyase family protein n=1 Tax=Microbacterium nymphoidis TaxID=2898586 RepID=UPI001E282AA9|nr:alginate lyase family protein [Microbacterium nymphoidis]MCD2497256.1 alginate lyase family protein [Microbacterium nymphoidis]
MTHRSSASTSQTSAAPLAIATAIILVLVIIGATMIGNGQAGAAIASDPSSSSTPTRTGTAQPSTTSPTPSTAASLSSPTPASPSTPAAIARLDGLRPFTSAAGFTHPGVLVDLPGLASTRAHILAGDSPWTALFHDLRASPYLGRDAPDFTGFAPAGAAGPDAPPCSAAHPGGCVSYCGSFNVPDVGCSLQQSDGRAVYGLSLMYSYTGKSVYAHRAIAILNGYASHYRGSEGSNGPLLTAWMAEQMIRGAELIRYTYTPGKGQPAFDVEGFSSMLRASVVPTLTTFDYGRNNGNWKLSAADGLMNAAVFLDDRALYDQAVAMWREATRAYIHLGSDGPQPITPVGGDGRFDSRPMLSCRWLADKPSACQTRPKTDPNLAVQHGQNQESCRDFGHASMGLAAIVNAAQTASLQGTDLYGEEQERIITGVLYTVQVAQNQSRYGWPAGFCAGTTEPANGMSLTELAATLVYREYVIRRGIPMRPIAIPGYPASSDANPLGSFIAAHRTSSSPVRNVSSWEALTFFDARMPRRGG